MTIGIPRSLLFYKHYFFWKCFFENYNIKIIISDETNQEIINNSLQLSNQESCLSGKLFIGHINNLIDKCDYILINREASYGINNIACAKLNGLIDNAQSIFPNVKFIYYNIDTFKKTNIIKQLKNILQLLNIKSKNIKQIYNKAIIYEEKIKEKSFLNQEQKLNSKRKILIVGHPYNIHDSYITKDIIKFLKENGIEVLYSDYFIENSNDYLFFSKDIYWSFNKDIMNSIYHYMNKVDGIIFITAFPCNTDSIATPLIRSKLKTPNIEIIIDELNNSSGLITRLESFFDILYEKGKLKI